MQFKDGDLVIGFEPNDVAAMTKEEWLAHCSKTKHITEDYAKAIYDMSTPAANTAPVKKEKAAKPA